MPGFVSVPAEAEMTEQEIIALIQAQNAKDFVWHVPAVNSGSTLYRPVQFKLSGGISWTNRAEGQNFIIQSTAAASKIAEYVYCSSASDDPLELKLNPGSDVVKHWYDHVNRIECFIGIYTAYSAAGNTATKFVGIELGTMDTSPEWPATVTSTAGGGVVQLRWKASTDSWEIYCNLKDGATPGVATPLVGVTGIYDSGNIPHGVHAALEWDPISTTPTVKAYINGKLGATYSGASVPVGSLDGGTPAASGTSTVNMVSGIFATTGTNAAGGFTALHFSGFKHIVKDFLSGVA